METIWVSGELRLDQRLVRARVESACTTAGSVLDVGCYDGSLLASLAPRLRRCGVEASAMAAQAARRKGVEILATRIRDLATMTEQFNVVCAVDVIEHVSCPRSFIALLADRVLPGGTLVISTGSTDTPAWRFAGGRYWYCSFPEHISFISLAWAQDAAPGLGLEVLDVRRFAYGDPDVRSLGKARRRFYRKVMQERIGEAVRSWLAPTGSHGKRMRVLGQPGMFDDHVVIAFARR